MTKRLGGLLLIVCGVVGFDRVSFAADFPVPPTVADGAKLVSVYSDDRFFEGPSWDTKSKKLLFTAFGSGKDATQILRLDGPGKVAVWADKTEGVNGTYLGNDGRLLGAQAFGHRVMSYGIGANGPADSQVLLFDTKLNQPNDIAQAPGGNIYFTDPDFDKREKSAVFLLNIKGDVVKIIHDMPVPNGLIVSNDGQTLYVGDSHLALWRAYSIQSDGTAGPGRVFFNPDTERKDAPDGMSIDEQNNLYFSGRGGVWVAGKFGNSLGLIAVPEFCSNVTFGGEDGKTLYLTCSKQVYSLAMKVRGGQFVRKPTK
ncbi:MAG: SMP-30/gluconolactonase/LRE family protein [Planctomycetales bacterium]|nr:SMP-30/gluconolactonase/LRE family protein [Planctomycetales bacterium]